MSSRSLDLRAVRIGFWKGVARAYEGGMEVNRLVDSREPFIDRMAGAMANQCVNEEGKERQWWHPRAVQLVAEILTMSEVARANYDEPPLDQELMEKTIVCLGGGLNSATHPE